MYIGRIVSVGMNKAGEMVGMYRVSSRSFPNRETIELNGHISVMPKPGFEDDFHKNPYIAYNCIRTAGKFAVVSNGSHTDPIVEKLATGMQPKEALTLSLIAMDFEKDHLDTPRIAGVISKGSNSAWLAIVRRDAVIVKEFSLEAGKAFYVATYEKNSPCCHNKDENFDVATAEEASKYIFDQGAFAEYEKPVTSASIIIKDGEFVTDCEIK